MKNRLMLLGITVCVLWALKDVWHWLWIIPPESSFTYIFVGAISVMFVWGIYRAWRTHFKGSTKSQVQSLLQDKNLPLDVRNAIHSFQTGTETLDDAIIVAPYHICTSKIYNLLKKQNFSFVKKEQKRFFLENYQEDFLQSLKEIHEGNLSSENAIVAWSYELLTTEQTKEILMKNNEAFPQVLQALSSPEFDDDRPCEEVMCIFKTEKRKHHRVR